MKENILIRLHGKAPFDRGGKVRWLLNEMDMKYEDHWLDKKNKENESPAYLKLNPMGRVPVAEINGQILFESGAICAYLSDLYLEKGMAPALDTRERADYQKWMYFASATIDSLQWRIDDFENMPSDTFRREREEVFQEELRDILKTIDGTLIKDRFLVGNRFSTADICVSYQLYWHRFWPKGNQLMKIFPRVEAYIDRMLSRPAAQTANWPQP